MNRYATFCSILLCILVAAGLFSCRTDTSGETPQGTTIILNEKTPMPSTTTSTVTTAEPDVSENRTTPITTTTSTSKTTQPVETTTVTTENISTPTTPKTGEVKIVGYITHWHISRIPEFDLGMLTHLIWQGVEVTASNDATLRTAGNAAWSQLDLVVEAGHTAGVEVLVSLIGPWGTSALNDVWASPELRADLIAQLKDMVIKYDLDGVDLDNENGCESSLYTSFIGELHEALSPLGKIISMAANPNRVCIDLETAANLDFINLMTYDMANGTGYPYHSTYEDSVNALDLWERAGIPREKILMGIPFYGRDNYGDGYEYRWIVNTYRPEDSENEVENGSWVVWWNGPDLVREKVSYVLDEKFGGVMIYEIGTDSPGHYSLLQIVYDQVAAILS